MARDGGDVVIRMGRRRVRAASATASSFVQTAALQLVGELDDEDAVLRDQADQRDEPDLRVDVERRGPAVGEEGMFGSGILRKVKMSAPNIASGTEPARMTNGSRKLLNCAASTRKISTSASPNAGRNLLPSVRSWRDSPV